MALESGYYAPSNAKRVFVWKSPDADGNGEEVWEDRVIGGVAVGRDRKKDQNGQVIRRYEAPEGFKNFPSFDGTENYVLVQENGQPLRLPSGEAVGIKEGSATVLHADGRVDVLDDEYAQYLFEQAHEKTDDDGPSPAEKLGQEMEQNDDRDTELAALRARIAEIEGPENMRGTERSAPVREAASGAPSDTQTGETKQEESSATQTTKGPEKTEGSTSVKKPGPPNAAARKNAGDSA